MKVFTGENSFPQKVNFIDDNNVSVGYDIDQCCCEHADWFIAEKITPYDFDMELNKPTELPGYEFDPRFFQSAENGELDEGRIITFRLVAEEKPDLYLHLFNAHNGYYGHGFELKRGGRVVRNETL